MKQSGGNEMVGKGRVSEALRGSLKGPRDGRVYGMLVMKQEPREYLLENRKSWFLVDGGDAI